MSQPPVPSIQNIKPPSGWENDELTKSFDRARHNQYGTYANKPMTRKLSAIDAQFAAASKVWLNPQSEIQAMFLLRCHFAFRTAAGLGMAGQACEATVMCRAMLEFAAYALHMHRQSTLEMIWLERHTDETALKKQKKAFQHVAVLESVKAANRHAGKRFEELYQRTIDFGGHPNERAIISNMQIIEEPGKRNMMAIMMHGDGIALDHTLKTVAQCGVNSLEMLQVPFNARFELLGINHAILKLRNGF